MERSFRRPSTVFSVAMSGLTALLAFMAVIPLFSVLYMLCVRGGRHLSWEALTALPPTAFEEGGGFGNAIVGTLVMVGIGVLITVPSGILSAIFLAEIGPESRVAGIVRFCAKVLTGFPSILAGVFVYGILVATTKTPSSVAGGVALAVLMLPTIMLTAEEAIRTVPRRMREAAIGMGATQSQTVCRVMLPTAMPGIMTGIMLAVARAAGETAPLLFTALFSNYWIMTNGKLDLMQPTASLAVLIYNFSGVPFENQKDLAWAAALVLVLIVLAANLAGQVFSRHAVRD
ncbi:MAG: phosphate ABC transporter permease PstA [Planctomycetota bacterium]